ncbi:MAG: hypothetical protein IKT35_04840, partial [Clostridia bacterium]|nr:hypothetical protein [Clostridia bacterium]
MLGKELKHLSRKELVDIIYQLKKNEDEMKEEIESLKKELEDGTPFVKESAVMLRSVGIKGVVLTVVSSVLSI